jgi:hypothetical protein
LDDWAFAADEMVLGTLVGSVALFFFPTVAMYYLYLAVARAMIWVLQESLRAVAVLSAAVPFYPLYLFLCHGDRVPSGVAFTDLHVIDEGGNVGTPTSSAASSRPGPFGKVLTPTGSLTGGSGSQRPATVQLTLTPLKMQLTEAVTEFVVLARFLLSATASPGRVARFVFQATEKPVADLRGAAFLHLTRDAVRPTLLARVSVTGEA